MSDILLRTLLSIMTIMIATAGLFPKSLLGTASKSSDIVNLGTQWDIIQRIDQTTSYQRYIESLSWINVSHESYANATYESYRLHSKLDLNKLKLKIKKFDMRDEYVIVYFFYSLIIIQTWFFFVGVFFMFSIWRAIGLSIINLLEMQWNLLAFAAGCNLVPGRKL